VKTDQTNRHSAPFNVQLFQALTPRECEVAALVSTGISNRAIAEQLGISVGTIGIHLHHVYQKLQITSRTMLAVLYTEFHSAQIP
jgi:DNA-binding NarL/FixJ family response regulator